MFSLIFHSLSLFLFFFLTWNTWGKQIKRDPSNKAQKISEKKKKKSNSEKKTRKKQKKTIWRQAHTSSTRLISIYSTFAPRLRRTAVKKRTEQCRRSTLSYGITPRRRPPCGITCDKKRKQGEKPWWISENRRLVSPPPVGRFEHTLLRLSLWWGERKAEKTLSSSQKQADEPSVPVFFFDKWSLDA